MIYLAAALFAAGNGLMWPSVLSLLSKLADEQDQGAVQGVAGSAGSLASIFGLVMGGLLFEQFGAATFLVSTALILVACGATLPLLRTKERRRARSDTLS